MYEIVEYCSDLSANHICTINISTLNHVYPKRLTPVVIHELTYMFVSLSLNRSKRSLKIASRNGIFEQNRLDSFDYFHILSVQCRYIYSPLCSYNDSI